MISTTLLQVRNVMKPTDEVFTLHAPIEFLHARPQQRNWKVIVGIPLIVLFILGLFIISYSLTPDPNAVTAPTGFISQAVNISVSSQLPNMPYSTEAKTGLEDVVLPVGVRNEALPSTADRLDFNDASTHKRPTVPEPQSTTVKAEKDSSQDSPSVANLSSRTEFWAFEGVCVLLFAISFLVLRRKDKQYLKQLQRRVDSLNSASSSSSSTFTVTEGI